MGLKQLLPGGGSGGGGGGEGPTDEQLELIGGIANDAKTIAQGAKTESAAAAAKADAAKTAADGYSGQITAANTKSDEAKADALAAAGKADTAAAKADAVTATADAAALAASQAGTKADTAKSTADTAKATADGLSAAVTAAGTKADEAKTTADGAATAVAGAVTKADAAKAAADAASAAAGDHEARLDSIEGTAASWMVTISQASAEAAAANLAAQSAKDQVTNMDTALVAVGTKADNAKTSADAATTAAATAGTKAQTALDATDGLATDIVAAQGVADAAQAAADSALVAANAANANLTDLQNDVVAAQDSIEVNTFDITALTTRVTTAEADIAALEAGGGGGGGTAGPRAFKTLALYGDSLSGNNSDLSKLYTRGFLTFALQMSDHRVYFDSSMNFGVGGEDSAAILARVNTVIAKKPDIVLLETGGNDTNRSIATDTTIANVKATVEALVNAGIRVILCTIYPTAGTTNPVHLTAVAKLNQWILDAKTRYNLVEVLDAYDVMFNNTTGLVKVGYTYDTTHPAAFGSWHLGRKLAEIIKQMVPINRHLKLTSPYDAFHATDFKQGNHFVNPRLTGTGGTSTGTGASGTIPNNWIVRMDEARGATVSCAVVADDNGFNVLEITLGGTITAGALNNWANYGHIYIGEVMGSDANTTWNSTPQGSYLRNTATFKSVTLEAEVENLVGVVAVGSEIFHLSNGGTSKPMHGDGLLTQNVSTPNTIPGSLAYPTEATPQKLTLHNEPETHTGVANGYRFGLHISLLPGTAVSGKIRIQRPAMRAYEAKLVV
ncbi:GDSL-like lipase [Pseudomonas phage nickie]|uniref:GDSL-like lipase n=1 Tax=Pseudomonas phage nickie TaxID=2048977 RepID=A0A2H4P705_9CAUD|nr:lipase [Pseudomonas phage nickie]ATW57973.1 GDSL-like lipase [Pseudomonas phage nickie]